MNKNMGSWDKTLRAAFAVVIALLYYTDVISGTVALVLGAVAIVFFLTSVIGFCPLYSLFNFSTCKVDPK